MNTPNLLHKKNTSNGTPLAVLMVFTCSILGLFPERIVLASELSPRVYYDPKDYPNVTHHSVKKASIFIQYLIEAERSTHYSGLGMLLKETPELFFDIISRYPDVYATYVNNHSVEFEKILESEKPKNEGLSFKDMLGFFSYRNSQDIETSTGFCAKESASQSAKSSIVHHNSSFIPLSKLPVETGKTVQSFYGNYCVKKGGNNCVMSATNFHQAMCRAIQKDYAYKDSVKNCNVSDPRTPPCDPTHIAVLARKNLIKNTLPEATQALLASYCSDGAKKNSDIRKLAFYADDPSDFDPSNYETFVGSDQKLKLFCTYPIAQSQLAAPKRCSKEGELLKCPVLEKELCAHYSASSGELSVPLLLDSNNPNSFFCKSTHSVFMNTALSYDNKRPSQGTFQNPYSTGEIKNYSSQVWSEKSEKQWSISDGSPTYTPWIPPQENVAQPAH